MEGLILLAGHLAADWPLQPDWMAAKKLTHPKVRAAHVAVYTTTVTATAALATNWPPAALAAFAVGIGVPHYVVDSKRWKEPVEGFESRPIWFDQVYHIVTLALVAGIVGWWA